eukprot:Awhi_evm1s11703
MIDGEDIFAKTLDIIFNRWSTLVLAIEHSFGGPDSEQKAADMYFDLLDYLKGN